jgi:uncharacterized protein YcfJ
MNAITTATNRIHPLMAAAAVSVIVVCAAGTAAITGVLPSSHGAPEAQGIAAAYPAQQMQAQAAGTQAYLQPQTAQPYVQAYQPAAAAPVPAPSTAIYVQPAPVVQQRAPEVHRAPRHVVHHYTEARHDQPVYAQRQSEPVARQPNYVAMGTGAVIGGLVGNQVGSGNGRKLATVAGIIGGGFLGNEIANRER